MYYKVTYGDGDQEDMDEGELIHAIALKEKKDSGQEIFDEAVVEEDLSGLSEEGSVYDSEEDKRALKEAKKKRKAVDCPNGMSPLLRKKTNVHNKMGCLSGVCSSYLGALIQCLASQCQGTILT